MIKLQLKDRDQVWQQTSLTNIKVTILMMILMLPISIHQATKSNMGTETSNLQLITLTSSLSIIHHPITKPPQI